MAVVKTLPGMLALDIMTAEFVVTHHDVPKFAGSTHNECFVWLLKNQSSSVDRATKHEGWSIKTREQVLNDPDPETIVMVGAYGKFGSRKAIRDLVVNSNTFGHYEHVSGFIGGRPIEGNYTRSELIKLCL